MKRKKKHEEHVDEAWLLPYSDMLTLLLALFIVMFAMAKVDDEKFQEIKSEFGTILSSHHSNSSVIGSVIDMGETTPRKKAATSAEAQAQEAAVRTQLENQQLEKISDQLAQKSAWNPMACISRLPAASCLPLAAPRSRTPLVSHWICYRTH